MTGNKLSFSRFDLAVLIVSLLLIGATVTLAYVNRPEAQGPVVAYLNPAYGGLEQLWIAPVDDPANATQLTESEGGIYNFGVSADGRLIVYAQRDPDTGLNDLYLLNLQTRQVEQLTDCVATGADCRTPVFHPNGQVIAYERMNTNSEIQTFGPGAIRIWILDMGTRPYTTQPLSPDAQIIGHSPVWSARGDAIAFYSSDIAQPGIMLFTFGLADADTETSLKYIPGNHGTMGSISPDGSRIVFPEMAEIAQSSGADRTFSVFQSYLKIADMNSLEFIDLTQPSADYDDINASWHPDGRRLAITRKPIGEDGTKGYQYYLYDTETDTAETLVFNELYTNGFMDWNLRGDKLVYQRIAVLNEDGTPAIRPEPEIMVLDMTDNEQTLIAENAFHPRWVLP